MFEGYAAPASLSGFSKSQTGPVMARDRAKVDAVLRDRSMPDVAAPGKAYVVHWADGRGVFALRTKANLDKWLDKTGDWAEIISIKYGVPLHAGKTLKVQEAEEAALEQRKKKSSMFPLAPTLRGSPKDRDEAMWDGAVAVLKTKLTPWGVTESKKEKFDPYNVPEGHAIRLEKSGAGVADDGELSKVVPQRKTHLFALHPKEWEWTYNSLTGKDFHKIVYHQPRAVKIAPGTLVADMGEATNYLYEKDPTKKAKHLSAYKNSVVPYEHYAAGTYSRPELLIPKNTTECAESLTPVTEKSEPTVRDDDDNSVIQTGAKLAALRSRAQSGDEEAEKLVDAHNAASAAKGRKDAHWYAWRNGFKPRPTTGTRDTTATVEGAEKVAKFDVKTKESLGTFDGLEVFIVEGGEVRAHCVDFAGGGNPLAYPCMPNEIWIERSSDPFDQGMILLHEITEYVAMKYGKEAYEKAHARANEAEAMIRRVAGEKHAVAESLLDEAADAVEIMREDVSAGAQGTDPTPGIPTLRDTTSAPDAVNAEDALTRGPGMAAMIAKRLAAKKVNDPAKNAATIEPTMGDNNAPSISPHQSGLQMPPDLK